MSQLYTLDEIKQQNGKNGAKTWVVIHDNVYDVSDYLKDVRNISEKNKTFLSLQLNGCDIIRDNIFLASRWW